jgi:anti-anti-sigma factor
MTELLGSKELEVERGPDWLFVRLRPDHEQLDQVAEQLWVLLNKHFVYRLVLEMDEVDFFPSMLMGQLVMLQKRVLQHDGALRLCGLSPECEQALHFCRLDHTLAHFETRADAVRGSTLAKPR